MKKIIGLICALLILQRIELKRFRITKYQFRSPKLEKKSTICVLSDLHGKKFGWKNSRLLSAIRKISPDIIICTGDMISNLGEKEFIRTSELMQNLCEVAPVYYGMGNHEQYLSMEDSENHKDFLNYMNKLQQAGVHILNNESVQLNERKIQIAGLSLPVIYYKKKVRQSLESNLISNLLPSLQNGDDYKIMIAHNPAYGKEYSLEGADLVLSGHTHGGLIRIPGIGSLISPELTWRPAYDAGYYRIGNSRMIVSKGLGTHTFHIRIFDRAEILQISLEP